MDKKKCKVCELQTYAVIEDDEYVIFTMVTYERDNEKYRKIFKNKLEENNKNNLLTDKENI